MDSGNQAQKALAFVQGIDSYNRDQGLKNMRMEDKFKVIRERFKKQ